MPNITDTVTQALRQNGLTNYEQQARPIVQALVERESRIFTGIVEQSVAMGADRQQVEQALRQFDMEAPPWAQGQGASGSWQGGTSAQGLAAAFGGTQQGLTQQGTSDLVARIERLEQYARQVGDFPS